MASGTRNALAISTQWTAYYTVVYGPFKIVIPVAELVVHHKIRRPSDYLVHSPKLAFLGQQATLDQYITNRYGKPFLQKILAGVK